MSEDYSQAVHAARDYYNSEDADNFYYYVWGGEDIHIGWYEPTEQTIKEASRQTVERMADTLKQPLDASSRVLDLGAGYGGAARYLADRFGCHVTALNLAEAENERNREYNRDRGLTEQIDVIDASFEAIPGDAAQYDVVWSQDAILHSGNREQVIKEIARVLKPGGEFVFTDPMCADDCPPGVLRPILDRIHLDSLGSPTFYLHQCKAEGLSLIGFEDATKFLIEHYSRVRQETERQADRLKGFVSEAYQTQMKAGLQHWIDGGAKGYLAWGIFHFQKPLGS